MKEKKLVPKKRFKSYTGKWNLLLLGNHSIIKGRLGWKNLRRDEYVDEGPSMIAGRHIKNGTIDWNAVDHIPVWRYEESPEIMLEENRSEEHTSELQSRFDLVCRLLLEKKKIYT